jgi:TonB family protein
LGAIASAQEAASGPVAAAPQWGYMLAQGSVSNCGGAAILTAQEREPQFEAQIANDISVFSCYVLLVRNDTPNRIQCQVSVEQPFTDQKKKPLRVESGIVLDAEATRSALESFVLAAQPPRAPTARCFVVPETAPPFERKKKCEGTFSAPSPDGYYPDSSKANFEQGGVVIEYGVTKGSTRPKDVRVVTSSGSTGLDTAALQVAYDSVATHRCTDARYRARIVFRLADQ